MGKPSKASRKNDANRLQRRRQRNNFFLKQIKQREEELGDLQIKVQKLQQFIEGAGEKVIYEFNKLHHDQSNLLKWTNLYVEQIKNMEEEIHSLKLKLYVHNVHNNTSTQPSQEPSQESSQQQSPQQQSLPPQPFFKSLDEYFKYEKKQKEQSNK